MTENVKPKVGETWAFVPRKGGFKPFRLVISRVDRYSVEVTDPNNSEALAFFSAAVWVRLVENSDVTVTRPS